MTEEKYPYIPLYISTPSQVKYYDVSTGEYKGGIVLQDNLIFCDGEMTNVNDYVDGVASKVDIEKDDVIITLSWNDLSKAILSPQ